MARVEEKLVPVGDGSRREWAATRRDDRFTFVGPLPGEFLFTSVGAESWSAAVSLARRAWNGVDPVRRDRWYGPRGRYTTGAWR